MSETPQEQEQAEVEATTPPAEAPAPGMNEGDQTPAQPSTSEQVEQAPTVEEVQERTEAAVQDAGQPIPDDQAPGYGDEATKDSTDIEGSDDARRVHPDTGGYQYTGDDSAAQVVSQSADE